MSDQRAEIERAGRVDEPRARAAIDDFLRALGFDVSSPHLAETGARVVEAWTRTLLAGHDETPEALLAERFSASSRGAIIVRDIPVLATCPHHLLPMLGVAHLAYRPAGWIVGFGRLPRLVDCLARRLTLQETLTEGLVDALDRALQPEAVAAVVVARHLCVAVTEPAHAGVQFRTVALRGAGAEGLLAELEAG